MVIRSVSNCIHSFIRVLNPFESRGSYNTTSKYEGGTLAVDGWAVTFGTARSGLSRAPARPYINIPYLNPRCVAAP